MRGYDGNEVYRSDGLDEYETDGEEEEVEEEEEAPKLTKEELEYLELRQKLKEAARRRMKKENGASVGNSSVKKYRPPNDNFGSFFGPSQPVIAQRVIQESKSLLENQHLAARISNSTTNGQSKKAHVSTNSAPRPGVRDPPPRVIHEAQAKLKAQKLKDNRDYSFLLSEDSELPLPKKDQPPRNVPMTNSDARQAQAQSKSSRQSGVNHNRPSLNGRDERRSGPTNHQVQKKPAYPPQVASSSKQRPNITSSDSRKQLGSNAGNGPGRPTIRPPSKMSAPPPPNKASLSNKFSSLSVDKIKRPVSGGAQKAPLPKVQPSMQRQEQQRRDVREPERDRLTSRMSTGASKLQSKPPPKHTQQRPPSHGDRPKKRPSGPYMDDDEDVDPRAMIRRMFGYNPNKFRDVDDDDSDMEANFDDIQKEEKRSARIAREEDEIEARLIEEEEKRERLRKEAKRRKLSQR